MWKERKGNATEEEKIEIMSQKGAGGIGGEVKDKEVVEEDMEEVTGDH